MEAKTPSSDLREIRQYLAKAVRDDWNWPLADLDLERYTSSFAKPVVDYRERYYGTTSDSEGGDLETKEGNDPYQFDSPDSVSQNIEQKRVSRKRKRQQVLEEEMEWNTGLYQFVRRRNAWTGATSNPTKTSASAPVTAKNGAASLAQDTPMLDLPTSSATSTASSSDSTPQQDPQPPAHSEPDPLIPIAPPILPSSHPLRAATLDPKTYPEIYTKIVMSSRTPTVPINLADMTRALVQGWKDSGEWPPKSTAAEPMIARKKSAGGAAAEGGKMGGKMGGKGRVLRILKGEVGVGGRGTGLEGAQEKEGEGQRGLFAQHPHVKKGVQSMKRVFRLSGGSGTGTPRPGTGREAE